MNVLKWFNAEYHQHRNTTTWTWRLKDQHVSLIVASIKGFNASGWETYVKLNDNVLLRHSEKLEPSQIWDEMALVLLDHDILCEALVRKTYDVVLPDLTMD